MKHTLLFIILLTSLISGCASNQQVQEQASASNNDPLESFNRAMWDFNWDTLDKHVVRPATVFYSEYTPRPVRTGLINAVRNLDEPGNIINSLLQGKPAESASSLGRFAINSTVGLLGLVDVAQDFGLERKREDFGQTLGVWGVDTGPYVMLPALGPTDTRSMSGFFTDFLYWPLNDLNLYWNIFGQGIKVLEARSALMAQEQLINDSLDSYSFVKEVYFQNLANQVADGVVQDVEEFSEEDEELDALLEDFD